MHLHMMSHMMSVKVRWCGTTKWKFSRDENKISKLNNKKFKFSTLSAIQLPIFIRLYKIMHTIV